MKIYALLACLFLHAQIQAMPDPAPSTPASNTSHITIAHDSDGHVSATLKPNGHSAVTLVLDKQGTIVAQKKLVCIATPFKIFSKNSRWFMCNSNLPSEQEIELLKAAIDKHAIDKHQSAPH